MKQSEMMNKLYGQKYANRVSARLDELSPDIDDLIQTVAYDQFWAREGLSIKEKSLATISALVALGKEEQTLIHMNGFLNAGGTERELENLIIHLAVYCGFPTSLNALSVLKQIKDERIV